MRHHTALIAMRRRGQRPPHVLLEVGHVVAEAKDWPRCSPSAAHLAFDVTDDPRLLDLRFLVGCDIAIDGYWPEDEPQLEHRLRQLFEATIRARANSVCVRHLFPKDEVLLWHA